MPGLHVMKRSNIIRVILSLFSLLAFSSVHAEKEITESTKFVSPSQELDEKTLQELAREIGRMQAEAILGAKIGILSAFPYTGKTFIETVDGARIIAVEVVVYEHKENLDFDDFEIVNRDTNESYGSDPDIKYLNKKKEEVDWSPNYSGRIGREHVLLIYAFPENVQNFGLRYWGLDLVTEKMVIQESQSDLLNIGLHVPKK